MNIERNFRIFAKKLHRNLVMKRVAVSDPCLLSLALVLAFFFAVLVVSMLRDEVLASKVES